jgi:phosphoenolpyruvate carboxylase
MADILSCLLFFCYPSLMQTFFPITMATQHPDNALSPWWLDKPFVATQDEINEVVLMLGELQCDEYMWDWEGKYVDEAVGEKLLTRAADLLKSRTFGEDVRLTYRIPAFDGEKMHRMARAMMNILSLADLSRDCGLPHPLVTEMFLPLTTSAEQPMKVRQAFREIEQYHRAVFHGGKEGDKALLDTFEVTPLIEDVDSLLSIENILRPYWESLQKERTISDQRIFIARSDPAMNAGLVPAVLAAKVALSTAYSLASELGFSVHPIIGTGSLPFRGSVNPLYTQEFMTQYAGVRTYSIQSAFRYDYPLEDVKKALATMQREVPLHPVVHISDDDRAKIMKISQMFSALWRPTIEAVAPLINQIAAAIPPRRERLQHIGLFGYSRGIGEVKLPRAIGFTASLYSIGVPPELIATGRGLRMAQSEGLLDVIERMYPLLRHDLTHAGKYFNAENLALLAKDSSVWAGVQDDIRAITEILGIPLEPEKPRHIIHRNLTSTIYQRLKSAEYSKADLERDIVEAGVIRRSLG